MRKNKQEKKQALQVEGAAAGAAGPVSGVESMDVEADGAAKTREDRFKCPRWMSFQKAKVARERVEMFDVLQEALRLQGDELHVEASGLSTSNPLGSRAIASWARQVS